MLSLFADYTCFRSYFSYFPAFFVFSELIIPLLFVYCTVPCRFFMVLGILLFV